MLLGFGLVLTSTWLGGSWFLISPLTATSLSQQQLAWISLFFGMTPGFCSTLRLGLEGPSVPLVKPHLIGQRLGRIKTLPFVLLVLKSGHIYSFSGHRVLCQPSPHHGY